MKVLAGALLGVVLVVVGQATGPESTLTRAFSTGAVPRIAPSRPLPAWPRAAAPADLSDEALTGVVKRNCVICHNDQLRTGNLSLETFDVANAAQRAEAAEKMISKLRLGMMPPPGLPRPGGDTLAVLVETLEQRMDRAASRAPRAGSRTFQRLNRAEYALSIEDLLGLEIDPDAYLPPDTKSDNFDNIADVQMASATVMDSYLTAASEISRMAIGDPAATATQATYAVPRAVSQWVHIEGTPRGTRGGLSVLHTFPADGEYVFSASFYTTLTGTFFGKWVRGEHLEISIDGERVALIEVDRFLLQSDPDGEWMRTEPIPIKAGQHRVSAAFLKTFEGPVEDLVSPIRQSLVDRQVGYADGFTLLPHLWELEIRGPQRVTGISETPSRRLVFTCRPSGQAEVGPCAREIVARLGGQAYRRPLTEGDLETLMSLYETGAAEGGFEVGIRTALEGILASPDFLFRIEEAPRDARGDRGYRIDDSDLATRLSFFLWGGPPDEELLRLARAGDLSDRGTLEKQVRRMLADPRSTALATRFGAQWLRLQDLDKVAPRADEWPNFDQTLRDAMHSETELFLNSIVREDRSVLDLLTADYTFVNEALAKHYGIPGVAGERFRRVALTGTPRRGLLGQGSILVQTSHADRTSPVLRGKWVMEVLLNSPPPPPPPNVPPLEQTEGVQSGRLLTVKQRMEMHRAAAVCRACHQFIDPLGLALENFDVTGEWRIRDSGNPVDPSGMLWDGTELNGPEDLRQALLKYRTSFLRTFTKNLMAYAIGRRVEHFDQPAIRAIARQAAEDDYRLSSFIVGVVSSDAFQMKQPTTE